MEFLAVRSMSTRLDDAAKRLKTLKEEPENDVKLQIYALYKQVRHVRDSPNPTSVQSVLLQVSRASFPS